MKDSVLSVYDLQLKFYKGDIGKAFNSLSTEYRRMLAELCGYIIKHAEDNGYKVEEGVNAIRLVPPRFKVGRRDINKNRYYISCWELTERNAPSVKDIDKRKYCEYDLDHIVPIIYGYKNNIPIELIASKENLRIIPHADNFKKAAIITQDAIEILGRWERDGLIKNSAK
jgi:hypothetical protein